MTRKKESRYRIEQNQMIYARKHGGQNGQVRKQRRKVKKQKKGQKTWKVGQKTKKIDYQVTDKIGQETQKIDKRKISSEAKNTDEGWETEYWLGNRRYETQKAVYKAKMIGQGTEKEIKSAVIEMERWKCN